MKKTIYHTPTGDTIENIKLETMKQYMLDDHYNYWSKGCGDGFIEYYRNNKEISTMMIGQNNNYGIYLRVVDHNFNKEFLSLYNKELLNEVTETAEELYASIGLFLPIELAWEGIKQYLLDGTLSEKIKWVDPDIIPEEGNY